MAHYVYILQSLKDNKYYIGSTSDVEARLSFHNDCTCFFSLAMDYSTDEFIHFIIAL